MKILYISFIYPLETSMQWILEYFSNFLSYGYSIIILSFIVNIILLPLYYYAEFIQKKETDIQHKMYPALLEIKQKYSGEMQYYKMRDLYKKYKYHPIMGLRSIFGFALQVPFFIAAYHMLSNYNKLNGVSFLFLDDLGKPDGILFGINLMPILMTFSNLFSLFIYKGNSLKSETKQLFFMAFLFLILLYNSSAGLVLYWTFNNIFSFFKNLIQKKFI